MQRALWVQPSLDTSQLFHYKEVTSLLLSVRAFLSLSPFLSFSFYKSWILFWRRETRFSLLLILVSCNEFPDTPPTILPSFCPRRWHSLILCISSFRLYTSIFNILTYLQSLSPWYPQNLRVSFSEELSLSLGEKCRAGMSMVTLLLSLRRLAEPRESLDMVKSLEFISDPRWSYINLVWVALISVCLFLLMLWNQNISISFYWVFTMLSRASHRVLNSATVLFSLDTSFCKVSILDLKKLEFRTYSFWRDLWLPS